MMITGRLPFDGTSKPEVFGKIKSCAYPPVLNVSQECRSILQKMLVVDTDVRSTAAELLQHPWFKILDKDDASAGGLINAEVFSNLQKYRGQSALRKAAMNMLIKMTAPQELTALTAEFYKIDTDMSGFIEIVELKKAIAAANLGDNFKIDE